MYERLFDKAKMPLFNELSAYCKENGERFEKLNDFLSTHFSTTQEIRFPYGNNYGWSVTHRKGKKLMCDIFAEAGAFTVMLRLTDEQFMSLYPELQENTRKCIDNRYPCGNGGWIHYRVNSDGDLRDIEILLNKKCLH